MSSEVLEPLIGREGSRAGGEQDGGVRVTEVLVVRVLEPGRDVPPVE